MVRGGEQGYGWSVRGIHLSNKSEGWAEHMVLGAPAGEGTTNGWEEPGRLA